jgi:hypothetical protein
MMLEVRRVTRKNDKCLIIDGVFFSLWKRMLSHWRVHTDVGPLMHCFDSWRVVHTTSKK